MVDLDKTLGILQGTQSLMQAQQQTNAAQSAPPATAPAQPQAATNDAANQLFAQLGQVLNEASTQTAQPNTQMADLQKQAALLSARVNSLVAEADALEEALNLAPTPEQVDVSALFAQFEEILGKLTQELNELNKQIAEKKAENEMTVKQKPTSLKPGEDASDMSFNQTLSLQ